MPHNSGRKGRLTLIAPAASASLTAARRTAELTRATSGERIDVLVIGGGITGAGAALDAASRGLRTVLIEANDLAFGTSRWSSKLAHGGLRYLANGDVATAYECAVERGNLLRHIAPHLVRPTPNMLPLVPAVSRSTAFQMGLGIFGGDVLRRAAHTPNRELPMPQRLSAVGAARLAPSLATAGLRGGLVFHDGQIVDDARLVVAVARTAASHGSSILTHVRAETIAAEGVRILDGLTGETGVIPARAVINATGVWAAELAPELRLTPSRGTHVVLDGAAVPGLRANLTLPYPGAHNRFLILLPQLDGRLYLGLTDDPVGAIDDVPIPLQSEIDELVGALTGTLGHKVDAAHVLGAFTGLRPLLADGAEANTATADLSRRHRVIRGENGAVHAVGGKLTTYRRMAQDAVDAAVDHTGLAAGPCRTATLPLIGADSRRRLAELPGTRLQVARYGTEVTSVIAMERAEPRLGEHIAPGVPVTHAELRFSVLHEGVLDAGDLLDRRFRVGLVADDRAAALPAAEEAIAWEKSAPQS